MESHLKPPSSTFFFRPSHVLVLPAVRVPRFSLFTGGSILRIIFPFVARRTCTGGSEYYYRSCFVVQFLELLVTQLVLSIRLT